MAEQPKGDMIVDHRRIDRTLVIGLLVVLSASTAVVASARAQGLNAVPTTMTPIYMNNTIGLLGIDAARRANRLAYPAEADSGNQRRSQTKALAQPARAPSFTVGTNAVASSATRAQFVALVQKSYPPETASAIITAYTQKPVREAFREMVSPFGLSDRDFRDVSTAYLVAGWMIANQAPVPTVAQVAAVRAQIANGMQMNPPVYDDVQRQIAAEQMMYEITSMIYARQEGEKNNDSAGLERMAGSVAENYAKTKGIDLRNVVLSANGVIPR